MKASIWSDMFYLTLLVVGKVVRLVLVYGFLVVALRLAGRRELAEANACDVVVLLTLSNTVQNTLISDDNSVTGGLLGAATLLAVNYFRTSATDFGSHEGFPLFAGRTTSR